MITFLARLLLFIPRLLLWILFSLFGWLLPKPLRRRIYKKYDLLEETNKPIKKPDPIRPDAKRERAVKHVQVERVNNPNQIAIQDEVRVVGFAKVFGFWTKKVIAEKAAELGMQQGVNAKGGRGYWASLVGFSSRQNVSWRHEVGGSRKSRGGRYSGGGGGMR